MPALDEAGADLRRDEPLALEDADREATEADEQHRDASVPRERLEQRLDSTTSYSPSCSRPNGGVTVRVPPSSSNADAAAR